MPVSIELGTIQSTVPITRRIVIKGKVYDLTDFVEKHPGGDIIMDGAGGDCTPMWESYHPLAMAKKGPH